MGVLEIIAIITAASKLAVTGAEIIERMSREGRKTMTPAEIAKLKAEQGIVDEGWQAQLERMRKAQE